MDVTSISGATCTIPVNTIHLFLKENRTLFTSYTHLLLHVDTNDIGNGLSNSLIFQYYSNLLDLIFNLFPHLKLIVSTILPRPIDFDRTKQIVIDINNYLASVGLKEKVLFVKTYKPLCYNQVLCLRRNYFVKMAFI